MLPAAEPTMRMPPEPRATMPRQDRQCEVVHRNGIEPDLGSFVVGVEVGECTEGRDSGVVAQDRDLALGQFGRTSAPAAIAIGQVDGTDLDLDAELGARARGRWTSRSRFATCDEDQRVSAAANSVASASPIPDDAPVTTARADIERLRKAHGADRNEVTSRDTSGEPRCPGGSRAWRRVRPPRRRRRSRGCSRRRRSARSIEIAHRFLARADDDGVDVEDRVVRSRSVFAEADVQAGVVDACRS